MLVVVGIIPEEETVKISDPPATIPNLLAELEYSPVSVSLVKAIEGAATVPLANVSCPEIEGASFKDRVIDEPKLTSPPPDKLVPAETVTLELVKAELGILVKVLDEPDKDLLVKVSVVSLPIRVVVVAGRLKFIPPEDS